MSAKAIRICLFGWFIVCASQMYGSEEGALGIADLKGDLLPHLFRGKAVLVDDHVLFAIVGRRMYGWDSSRLQGAFYLVKDDYFEEGSHKIRKPFFLKGPNDLHNRPIEGATWHEYQWSVDGSRRNLTIDDIAISLSRRQVLVVSDSQTTRSLTRIFIPDDVTSADDVARFIQKTVPVVR